MIVELPFGRRQLPVRLPEDADVTLVTKRPMPVLASPEQAVRDALDMAEFEASTGRSACIVICDVTRPVPNGLLLRPIVDRLLGCGIRLDRITILVATGLHRPNEGDELATVVGDPWVMANVRIVNHDANDDDAHVDLGETDSGTPAKLDRRFVDADVRIVTGLVEPHFMAGYSGGRKVVAPGIAHADTIRTFHSGRFMAHPNAVQCQLDGNPLHEEQLEIARILPGILAVNTVIDDQRRLSFVNVGAVEESHLAAVNYAEEYLTVNVPERFRTVVTSSAGFPLDQTYYQAVKGMVTPLDIVEAGGTLIVGAECGEGLGSEAFRASQQRLLDIGRERFLESVLAKRFADVDEWETQMLLRAQDAAEVKLHSALDEVDRALTGVEHVESVEDAVLASMAAQGDRSVAVVPEGPYLVPRCTA